MWASYNKALLGCVPVTVRFFLWNEKTVFDSWLLFAVQGEKIMIRPFAKLRFRWALICFSDEYTIRQIKLFSEQIYKISICPIDNNRELSCLLPEALVT